MVRASIKYLLVVAGVVLVVLLVATRRRNNAFIPVQVDKDSNTRERSNRADSSEGAQTKGDRNIKFGSPFLTIGKESQELMNNNLQAGRDNVVGNDDNELLQNPSVDLRKGIPESVPTPERGLKPRAELLGISDGGEQPSSPLPVSSKPTQDAVATLQTTTSSTHDRTESMSVNEPDERHNARDVDSETFVSTTAEPDEVTALPPMPTFYPSKDLFVRAVYFDGRPRDGHQNTSVFLVVCVKNITDHELIVGCQVDGRKASTFSVKLIGETPLWRMFYPKINHEEVLVHCYDLPVRNGSNAYIMYKMTPNSDVVTAASERPLVIPPPRIKPTSPEGVKHNMTIITCAKIFSHPPWLREWLTYQRTLGVDHVHLDVEDSFVKSGGLKQPFVEQMMKEGFLSVDIWKEYLGMWEIWYHNQGLIYEDCPYRFLGTYDYIVMLDTDDFFTPRERNELKMHYYINKYCRRNNVGSCKFRWIEYFPDVYGFNNQSTSDGNITRALRSYSHYNQGNPKSLHRTTALIDTATHYASLMMPKYSIFQVPVDIAYVAHVRKWKKLPGQGLVEGLPNSCLDHCINRILVAVVVCLVFVIFSLLGGGGPAV